MLTKIARPGRSARRAQLDVGPVGRPRSPAPAARGRPQYSLCRPRGPTGERPGTRDRGVPLSPGPAVVIALAPELRLVSTQVALKAINPEPRYRADLLRRFGRET
ncbi:hypothetical protein GCM10018781_62460 [Kitasatospora indigofera]|uniref:Uncharacterized protein n=1 Tax=Kitasatospora indigofera TaxID=67307 RepID=A0A919L335_9ACTN|nr:hypothetical protein GCM10018781_62460 [Kitasatospora indigofera]